MLAVAACGRLDAEEARICRIALPALNPPGGAITVLSQEAGAERGTVRIAYRVEREGATTERSAVCRFGPRISRNRPQLVGIATESGPLSGASVHLLQRYYVFTPEGAAGDPGPPQAGDGKPRFRLW